MGKKIAFIGAGSFGFTRGLVRDILSFPAFRDATLALMDIDAEKLGFVRTAVEQIVEAGKYPAKIEATFDRREALKDADGVVITILRAAFRSSAPTLRFRKSTTSTSTSATRAAPPAFSGRCARCRSCWTSAKTSASAARTRSC